MKCRKMKKMMNEMIDGTLPEKDKLKLSIHLKQCPGCRKLYNDLSKLVKAADELQVPTYDCVV
ncbi:MAG: zf-HC2 domain-containing protein, partial [Acidobacteriota bacterium]